MTKENGGKKILVAYATWSGVTRGVAQEIAKTLQSQRNAVDVFPVKEVKDVSEYDAVLVGTSLHMFGPVGDFRSFLKRNQKNLQNMPTAFFVVCANMQEDTPKNREQTLEWLNKGLKGLEDIRPVDIGLFAGAMLTDTPEYQKANFVRKQMIHAMYSMVKKQYGKNDFRDWAKIRAWADEVLEKFYKYQIK